MRQILLKYQLHALIPFNIALSFYALRGSSKIGFGPVDDHEIIRFLGPDRDLEFHEVFTLLFTHTEVGEWGASGRFRPSYYIIRLLETFVFGPKEHLWFTFRVVLLAIVGLFCSRIFIELFKSLPGLVRLSIGASTSLLIFGLRSWPDVAMRLGPSEIFLVTGTSVFLLLSVRVLLSPQPQRMWALTLAIALFTVGTKENAAVLLVGVALFVLVGNKIIHLSRWTKAMGFITCLVGGVIVLIPVINSLDKQVDVYGSTRDIKQLFTYGVKYFSSTIGVRNSLAFLLVVTITVYLFRRKLLDRRLFFTRLYLVGLLGLIPLSDYVFYQAIFTEPRYQILTQFSQVIILVLVFAVILEALHILKKPKFNNWSAGAILLSCIAAVAFSFQQYFNSTEIFRGIATEKIGGNDKFQNQISRIAKTLKTGKFDNMIIVVNNVWEYEPSFSTSHFVSFYHGEIPKYLYLNEMNVSPGLEQILLDQMRAFSRNGSTDWDIDKGLAPVEGNNLCVTFRVGPIDNTVCDAVLISQ